MISGCYSLTILKVTYKQRSYNQRSSVLVGTLTNNQSFWHNYHRREARKRKSALQSNDSYSILFSSEATL